VVVIGEGAVRFPQIVFDPEPGLEEAVAHLRILGHRQLLWVGPREKEGMYEPERYRALSGAAERQGMQVHLHDFDVRGIGPNDHLLVVQDLHLRLQDLVLPTGCTAIMCYNDKVGLALYQVLSQRGLSIPQDISVIGFDDRNGHFAIPAMTSISHALPAIGHAAATTAISLIEDAALRAKPPGETTVPSSLVVRSSTGIARTTA